MDMKKITVAVLVIAALMSLVVTAKESGKAMPPAASPKGSAKTPAAAPAGAPKAGAEAPKSGAAPTTLSIAGSFFSTFLVSFFAYYMQ